jgi:hypothetical protein
MVISVPVRLLNRRLLQTIPRATRDVHAFAREIVHWVGEVNSAIEHGHGGRFTAKTRKNLGAMRYMSLLVHCKELLIELFVLQPAL